jgi:hypothetical protein
MRWASTGNGSAFCPDRRLYGRNLLALKELIETGTISAVIDRRYP